MSTIYEIRYSIRRAIHGLLQTSWALDVAIRVAEGGLQQSVGIPVEVEAALLPPSARPDLAQHLEG